MTLFNHLFMILGFFSFNKNRDEKIVPKSDKKIDLSETLRKNKENLAKIKSQVSSIVQELEN